jgi:hypothetical protein
MTPAKRVAGITWLEFMALVVLLLIAGGVFLDRFIRKQETVEQVNVETTLRLYKMALQIRLAELISSNAEGEAWRLEVENPTLLMSNPPAGYAGEYRKPPGKGAWYFDSGRRELVYVPNLTRHLEAKETDGVKQLRFKIVINYQQVGVSGTRSITGVSIVTLIKYQWSCLCHSPILA